MIPLSGITFDLWLKKIILLFKFKNINCYLVKPEPLALLDRWK
jgi:hypothetical protein